MLCSAYVQVDLSPIIGFLTAAKGFGISRIHVAQEIPAGSSPARHRVVLHAVAPCDIPILFSRPRQRRVSFLRGQVRVNWRQGNLLIPNQFGDVVLVINREGLSPVALPAEHGIAQTVIDLASSHRFCFEHLDGFRDGLNGIQSTQVTAIAQNG